MTVFSATKIIEFPFYRVQNIENNNSQIRAQLNKQSSNGLKTRRKQRMASHLSNFGMKSYYHITAVVITMNHNLYVPKPLIKSSSTSKQIFHPATRVAVVYIACHTITNEKTAIISLRFNRVNQTPTRSTCNLRTTPISPFCHPCALPRFTIIINYSEHKNIFNDKALCLQWKFASYMFIGESRQSLRVNNNRKVM